MLKFDDEPCADTEREVIRIRQAMQRVQHPLYLHLITTLVDSMTLQIAAVEQAISNSDAGIARPSGRLDG